MEKSKEYVGFTVDTRSYTHETSDVNPDDEWSRASTSTSWTIEGVRPVYEDPEFAAKFVIKPGTYYLVYGIYSTGDSFGHDEGYSFESVEIYKSRQAAEKAVEVLNAHHSIYKGYDRYYRTPAPKIPKDYDQFSIKLVGGDRKKFSFHVPWNGYFETLDTLDIYTFTV